MNTRPTITPEIKLAAARKMVEAIESDCDTDGLPSSEEMAEDIADVASRYDDGYAIAKQLDDRKYWSIDMRIVEALDNYSFMLSAQLDKEIKKWVEENDIQPPFPLKTRVKMQSGDIGEIATIRRDTAEYLIKIDGDPKADAPTNRRMVVSYESVTEIGT